MKITIKTTIGIIDYYTTDEITVKEMPYMCAGYGFNGSSEATKEDLDKFWTLIDTILDSNNLSKSDYQTLISIQ